MKKTVFHVLGLGALLFLSLATSMASSQIEERNGEHISQKRHSVAQILEDKIKILEYKLKNQPFKKSNYTRALSQQLNRLNPYSFLSEEEKLVTRFTVGWIYYDYAENIQDIDEKAALYEQAKIHFEISRFPQANPFLGKIAVFDETYENKD